MELSGRQFPGRQVCLGLRGDIEAVSCDRPFQASTPYRDILGPALLTGIQQAPGFVMVASTGGQIGLAQPDPIVIGGQPGRPV